MIKLFRHIRKTLIQKNQMGKYFKYAIGEILLVVIGILIALQINNWNQNRINNITEKDTLISLKQDLDSALVQLDIKIRQNDLYRTSDSIALEVLNKNTKIQNDSILKLLLTHIYTPTFDPELGTLNEVLNTGKMEIIRSNALRNHISSWNKYMDELDEVDKRLIYLDDNIKTPLYSKHLPYRDAMKYIINPNSDSVFGFRFQASKFNVELESFFYTLEFENMLSNYFIYGRIQQVRLNDVKNKMMDMIALIDNILKND